MLPTVSDAFSALLRTEPSAPVAWTPAGSRTRAELDRAASAIRTLLARLPVGVRVAVAVRDGFTLLATVLALWRRGDCALLLDAADPPPRRVELAALFGASAIVVDGPEVCRPAGGAAEPAAGYAAIKLTSGSTAHPRGIAVTDAQLRADGERLEVAMGIGAGDRVFSAVPMSFSYGVGNLLVPALAHGRCLVLPDAGHPAGFVRAMREGAPTVLPAVPTLVRALVQGGFVAPPSLRLVLCAGAVLPPALARAFRQQCGRPVHAFYGATEAGGICYDQTGEAAERGAVGRPLPGVDLSLGDDGRVTVRSAAVGQALADDNPRDGVFCAPDLGVMREDELVLLGRVGDSFDLGGHKVHPLEVERLIAELPGVDEVAVVPWHDEHGRAACAAVVSGVGVDASVVRRHCRERLPPAKVPRLVLMVAALPRSDRGKLQRHEVERLLAAAPRPEENA